MLSQVAVAHSFSLAHSVPLHKDSHLLLILLLGDIWMVASLSILYATNIPV